MANVITTESHRLDGERDKVAQQSSSSDYSSSDSLLVADESQSEVAQEAGRRPPRHYEECFTRYALFSHDTRFSSTRHTPSCLVVFCNREREQERERCACSQLMLPSPPFLSSRINLIPNSQTGGASASPRPTPYPPLHFTNDIALAFLQEQAWQNRTD